MKKSLIISTLYLLINSTTANATTCTRPNDWQDAICRFPETPHPRCMADGVAPVNYQSQCAPGTANCLHPDGTNSCFGTLTGGHWFATPFIDGTIKRCQCGCFAEETKFETVLGTIKGSEIIEGKSSSVLKDFLVTDNVDGYETTFKDIKEPIWGPEQPLAYKFTTSEGHEITLSEKHPVVIADQNGKLKQMKRSDEVVAGDFFVTKDGNPVSVTKIEKIKYEGRMLNFIVDNKDQMNGTQNIVIANGLKMGDNKWQQYMALVDSRILSRADIANLILDQKK